jgi:RND family efflux transporter MFP subunit
MSDGAGSRQDELAKAVVFTYNKVVDVAVLQSAQPLFYSNTSAPHLGGAATTPACRDVQLTDPPFSPRKSHVMSTARLQRSVCDPATSASSRSLPKVTTSVTKPIPRRRSGKRGKWLTAGSLIAMLLVTVGWWQWRTDGSTLDAQLVYHIVEQSDLDIRVTERGNLESQSEIQVVCEVDDVPGDNINGTPIIWIVENGASVKKGDLIVELDAAPIQDRLDTQILEVEEERAEFKQAEVTYKNQKTQNETNLSEAQLAVDLAELALAQFGDNEKGTFQINLQDIELQVQEAEAGRLIEQTNLKGVETLYKLGYRSSGELAEARLNALRAERQLATAISKRRELVEYEFKKMKMELEGKLASAQRAYEQTLLDNEARLAQAEARLLSSKEQLAKEEEVLARYQEQIVKCKIYAPQDGMVAYATGGNRFRREEIRAGAEMRPRQTILTLPNLEKMQVKTAVHESVLDQIKRGLTATIRVDAFPEMRYRGSVASVAVLPDQGGWMSSDTKVYETVVTIDESVRQLKPGMTAVVEIHVDHLADVVSVPVQAIVQIEDQTWCYVEENGRPMRRCVRLGMTNNKFVEVTSGLEVGERVVLNPSAIPDSHRKPSPAEFPSQAAPAKAKTEGNGKAAELS